MNWSESLEYLGLERKKYLILATGLLLGLLIGFVNPILGLIPVLSALAGPVYLAEARRSQLKSQIPDVAMEIANLWGILDIREILKRSKLEVLRKAEERISRGMPVVKALRQVENEEPAMRPLIDLLILGYQSGRDISPMLNRMADQYSMELAIRNEMMANMLIQRVTIFAASGIIVPFVIGSTQSLVSSLPPVSMNPEIERMAILGSQIYVGIYAVLAGVFLGWTTGKKLVSSLLFSSGILGLATIVYLASRGLLNF